MTGAQLCLIERAQEPELEPKQKHSSPLPPSRGEGEGEENAVERAVDQVFSALGIANRRLRRLVRATIELEAEKGEPSPTTALAMIAAWNRQAAMGHLLHRKYGLRKFFGEGIWRNERRWLWNEELLRQQAQASVGQWKQ